MTTPSSNYHFLNYYYSHSTIMNNSTNSSRDGTSRSGDQVAAAGYLWFFSEIQKMEILVAVAVFVLIRCLRGKRKHGLTNWPFVGMLPSLVSGLRGNMYEWISNVLEGQNGTFTFRGPWFTNLNCVVTADPRNLEYLLKTKFGNFPKGGYFRGTLQDFLGDGIFNADEEIWQRQRKAASLEFHSAVFRRMTTESLVELVHRRLLPVLEESRAAAAAPVDLQDVLLRLTFDNVCMIAFGVDPGCLRPGLPVIPFAAAFEAATEATILRFVTPTLVWRAMRWAGAGSEGRLRESIKAVDDFAREVIRARKKETDLSGGGGGGAERRSDLLTVFMGMKDEEGKPFSDVFLRDICVNFILAGRDTSSVALSWFFWLVMNAPRVEGKIVAEISAVLADTRGGSACDLRKWVEEPLTFDEADRLVYLKAALAETLRLYPSVPEDFKYVVADDVLPDGSVVPAGSTVTYSIYSVGRMESIWGEDCMEFRPERWLSAAEDRFEPPKDGYRFVAFNGGPRTCLGKDLAYLQMKSVAAAVLLRFRLSLVPGHRVEQKISLTLFMKHGLKVNLTPREMVAPPQTAAVSA